MPLRITPRGNRRGHGYILAGTHRVEIVAQRRLVCRRSATAQRPSSNHRGQRPYGDHVLSGFLPDWRGPRVHFPHSAGSHGSGYFLPGTTGPEMGSQGAQRASFQGWTGRSGGWLRDPGRSRQHGQLHERIRETEMASEEDERSSFGAKEQSQSIEGESLILPVRRPCRAKFAFSLISSLHRVLRFGLPFEKRVAFSPGPEQNATRSSSG